MSSPSSSECISARAIAELNYCNPFRPERIRLEREVLQDAFIWTDDAWHKRVDTSGLPPNIDLMTERARYLAKLMREWMTEKPSISPGDIEMYENVVLYLVYNIHHSSLQSLIAGAAGRCEVLQ